MATHLGPEPSYCIGRTLQSEQAGPIPMGDLLELRHASAGAWMADATRLRIRAQRACQCWQSWHSSPSWASSFARR